MISRIIQHHQSRQSLFGKKLILLIIVVILRVYQKEVQKLVSDNFSHFCQIYLHFLMIFQNQYKILGYLNPDLDNIFFFPEQKLAAGEDAFRSGKQVEHAKFLLSFPLCSGCICTEKIPLFIICVANIMFLIDKKIKLYCLFPIDIKFGD